MMITVPKRYSSCHLCWLGRGYGTQSIPSVSSWRIPRGVTWECQKIWGEERQDLNMHVKKKASPNMSKSPPSHFSSSDVRGERKKSGSVTSWSQPWIQRWKNSLLVDVCPDRVWELFQIALDRPFHTCECGLRIMPSNSLHFQALNRVDIGLCRRTTAHFKPIWKVFCQGFRYNPGEYFLYSPRWCSLSTER